MTSRCCGDEQVEHLHREALAAGTVLHVRSVLVRVPRCDLDFSRLMHRHAYLAEVEAADGGMHLSPS